MSLLAAVLFLVGCVSAQEDPLLALAENIPGVPGEDYPIYAQPPDTPFACGGQVPGYYADPDANCQLYHICAGPEGGLIKYDFLCPNGTLFDQQYFVCNWWFNVDCSQAVSFYPLNEDVLAAMEAANPSRDGKSLEVGPVGAVSEFSG